MDQALALPDLMWVCFQGVYELHDFSFRTFTFMSSGSQFVDKIRIVSCFEILNEHLFKIVAIYLLVLFCVGVMCSHAYSLDSILRFHVGSFAAVLLVLGFKRM